MQRISREGSGFIQILPIDLKHVFKLHLQAFLLNFVCFKLVLELQVEILIYSSPGAGVKAAYQIFVGTQCLQQCSFRKQCCPVNIQCRAFSFTSWKWQQEGSSEDGLHWQIGPTLLNWI